jgi:hypothetical protein
MTCGAVNSPDVAVAVESVEVVGGVISIEGVELLWMNAVISGIGASSSSSDTGSLRRWSSHSSFLAASYLRTTMFTFSVLWIISWITASSATLGPGTVEGGVWRGGTGEGISSAELTRLSPQDLISGLAPWSLRAVCHWAP